MTSYLIDKPIMQSESTASTEKNIIEAIYQKQYFVHNHLQRKATYLILGPKAFMELKRQMHGSHMQQLRGATGNSMFGGLTIAIVEDPYHLEVI